MLDTEHPANGRIERTAQPSSTAKTQRTTQSKGAYAMAVIAWIGLGNMGGSMSVNLAKAGHDVRGFDLNAEAVAAAEAGGVKPAGSIADAVDGADVVFTMLPKGEHARAVYLGEEG